MKLVEILAKKLDAWPTGAAIAVQDGDARKTVKFGSKHANPSIALMGLKDVWQARDWKYTHQSDFDHSVLASDWETAIVTKEQWQAERDRQKGGEWKRHRGGKCPVSENSVIDVKLDTGDTMKNEVAGDWEWSHQDVHPRIMQYRVISQPQAEEVAPVYFQIDMTETNKMLAKTDQIDGPIKWRDTVNELDAYIEEFTRERDALIERLASEGFALIPAMTQVMGVADVPAVDMGDWRNLKEGDIIQCGTEGWSSSWKGVRVTVGGIERLDYTGSLPIYGVDDNGDGDWGESYTFISRP